jgi:hypothetical protein
LTPIENFIHTPANWRYKSLNRKKSGDKYFFKVPIGWRESVSDFSISPIGERVVTRWKRVSIGRTHSGVFGEIWEERLK